MRSVLREKIDALKLFLAHHGVFDADEEKIFLELQVFIANAATSAVLRKDYDLMGFLQDELTNLAELSRESGWPNQSLWWLGYAVMVEKCQKRYRALDEFYAEDPKGLPQKILVVIARKSPWGIGLLPISRQVRRSRPKLAPALKILSDNGLIVHDGVSGMYRLWITQGNIRKIEVEFGTASSQVFSISV